MGVTISRLAFTVRGVPMGKPRQTQRDKYNPSPAVQRYRTWADTIKWAARPHCRQPLDGALELCAVFYLPVPKSYAVEVRKAILAGEVAHAIKPDLKNLIAGLEDALNAIAWVDDAQIVSYGRCLKSFDDGKGPRAVVLAYRVGQTLDALRARHQHAGRLLDGLT